MRDLPLSADLAQTADWLRARSATGVAIDGVAASFLAEALDETALRVRALEDDARALREELRQEHVQRVIRETQSSAASVSGEAAALRQDHLIAVGKAAGVIVDLRKIFVAEMIANRGGDAA